MRNSPLTLAALALALGGCSLAPDYQRPTAPVAPQYPQGAAFAPAAGNPGADWQGLFQDPLLQQLIHSALQNNRDLRVAALNVAAYQA